MRMGLFVPSVGRNDGGPETYERRLVEHILTTDTPVDFDVFCFSQNARDQFAHVSTDARFHILQPASRILSLTLGLPNSLKKSGVDLYHAALYPPPFSPVPYVFTMHDVSMFTNPEFYPLSIRARLNPLIRRGLAKARSILCISEHCRQTTAEYFGIPLERMTVVHHGIDPKMIAVPKVDAREFVKEHYALHREYLLYIGKLEARKNIVRLIEAFAQLIQETDYEGDLVLAGKRYWDLHGIDETLERLGIADRVRELGYVPDSHLAPLYSASRAFVFPSLWEGFGFPVLEAMSCGTPVIASSVSSIPEIAGDAAVLVDPMSTESIAAGIAKVLESETFSDELIERGKAQAAKFCWKNTARETIDLYTKTFEQSD